MENKTSFVHNLEYPVEIDSKGKVIEAISVEVFAPTNQVFADVNVLDYEFQKARKVSIKESGDALEKLDAESLQALREYNETKKEPDIKPIDIVNEMVANGADITKCFMSLKQILTAGNRDKPMCRIDVEKMTQPLFNELHIKDTKIILGRFILDFLDSSQSM